MDSHNRHNNTSSVSVLTPQRALQRSTTSYECLNDNDLSCPSAPRQHKMKVSIYNKHVVVPMNNDGHKLIPIGDFPSLPFLDFATAPAPTLEKMTIPIPSTAKRYTNDNTTTSHKLSHSPRNQSLAHLNSKRKSIGARCA
mmetsp:Transcript_18359/g.38522  ORF Transcript_18359/g.38522 Transcript_18359/m.38522 type:complete len:140 (+) Transcript_18359:141-560(+)